MYARVWLLESTLFFFSQSFLECGARKSSSSPEGSFHRRRRRRDRFIVVVVVVAGGIVSSGRNCDTGPISFHRTCRQIGYSHFECRRCICPCTRLRRTRIRRNPWLRCRARCICASSRPCAIGRHNPPSPISRRYHSEGGIPCRSMFCLLYTSPSPRDS